MGSRKVACPKSPLAQWSTSTACGWIRVQLTHLLPHRYSSHNADRWVVSPILRQFLPVTGDVIRRHLTGADDAGEPFTMGVYPMLLDETCHLLAVDFDGKTWGDDASAYLSTCTRRGVPAALERSRSGNGGHVWLFCRHCRGGRSRAPAGRAASHRDHGRPARPRIPFP